MSERNTNTFIGRLQRPDREWSKPEQITLLITFTLSLFLNIVEQRFHYFDTFIIDIYRNE